MKVFFSIFFALIFSSSHASDEVPYLHIENPTLINVKAKNRPLIEVAQMINLKCEGKIDPIKVQNPDDLISLEFNEIPCKAVALIVQDFDAEKKET